jgi:HAE1 family hydrophobic/amphiphilic exporter-1
VTGGGIFISKPLAIVVIGGLVSSTILTLILVPVLYDLVERTRERVRRRRSADGDPGPGLTSEPEVAETATATA